MQLALLKGNRFNPWHLQVFDRLRGSPDVVAFRADSQVQRYFEGRSNGTLKFRFEPIYYDTQVGPPFRRVRNVFLERYRGREPRIVPFYYRLDGFSLIQSWELFTDWTAEAIRAREKYDIPVAVMVWDNIPFNMEERNRRAMKERALQAADRFIVHTERSMRMLDIEGADMNRVVRVNPGVDTETFAPGHGDRAAYGIPEDAFVILFVGWLLPRKGLDWLVLALRELTRDEAINRPIHLVAVGEGPGRDRIDAFLDRTGLTQSCSFLGPFPYGKMPEVHRLADTFVLPSIATPQWQEQFGMSLLEAMACGVPVLSTYSGAIPEIVGDAAVLCQPNDFVALYESLKTLVLNPRRREELSVAGRERVMEYYRLDAFAENISNVYESILG